MKKTLNYLSSTLFNSTGAHFSVSIEARLTKVRDDSSIANLCYSSQRGQLYLNPSIYLVFAYKGETADENKALYMSYPQLYLLREKFEDIKNTLFNPNTFIESDGIIELNPEFNTQFILTDIGQQKKWISFDIKTITNNDGVSKTRGVLIQISGNNNFASALTLEEFLTIYTIVKDLDLASLQVNLGLQIAIYNEDANSQQGYANNNYSSRSSYNNGGYYPQNQQQNYNGGYVPRGNSSYAPQAPRANGNGRYSSNPAPYQAQYSNPNPAAAHPVVDNPFPNNAPQKTSPTPVRAESAPILTADAIASVPTENYSWDDDTDAIFDDE